ncbi:putative dipeptidyl-aminopeptidase B [Choanephora cucurbitarum]|uniref:Putative dipeptidyl-aminopeptidase B n=1 Tax=Choanephora cucurbitarum TaxID=101091 RepID=A0A1C7NHQ6_9FUNG|nr:putative dipeptidyl-aminopeptidase B [Choanephora cucurbitarum]
MDARNSLSNILDDEDDDNTSTSSTSSNIRNKPVNYDYQKEDEGEENESDTPFLRGSIEQTRDVEAGERLHARKSKHGSGKWICMAFLLFILVFWLAWTIGLGQYGSAEDIETQFDLKKHIDLPDLFNDSFNFAKPNIPWVKNHPDDGVFSYIEPATNNIILQSIKSGTAQILINGTDLQVNNQTLDVNQFEVSSDTQFVLLKTNVTQQWRYSNVFNAYIYRVMDKHLFPLNKQSTIDLPPRISYATWSPEGHQLAYVLGNEIFITDLQNTTRVTFDGSSTVFNGVPDWVYEEEVFSKNYAMWWSPDSTHLAYLRFNETTVPEYHIQYYTSSNNPYPDEKSIKYPKAGSPNPLVSLHIYSLSTNTTIMVTSSSTLNDTLVTTSDLLEFPDTDRLITDVIWATETHSHLLFKQTNRVQDIEVTNLVALNSTNLNSTHVKHVRTYKPSDGGWIDSAQTMIYMPNHKPNDTTVRYLDVIDNGKGFMHLAVIRATDGKIRSPKWLTFGSWEVIPGSVAVDKKRQLVYFVSTEQSHLERHLYSITLKNPKPMRTKKCITCSSDPEEHAYYEAGFSPYAGYYVLHYLGPGIPSSTLKQAGNSSFELVLEDNLALKNILEEYELPRTRMVSVKSGGVDMDAMEILPPNFVATKKYPVLFHVYGGPGSQLATYQFELSWSTFLASKLGYIVVTVDGRGTGFKGRKYRSGVRKRLGELETIDQINAAKHWALLEYVDPSRIAIWGWSFGGYLTTKVVEANSGLFSAAMAVAPVTDWRFYDSVYTERYMLTPEMNPDGYMQSAVNNMTGFENTRYLLAHGTSDDNVHFQNSATLVDKLTSANIHNYQVQYYTDNDHTIQYHDAHQNVYHLLTNFLWESFGGEEYQHVRTELDGHFSGSIGSH